MNRNESGKYPDYPSDDEGGSGLIFHPELQSDYEENLEKEKAEKEEASKKEKKTSKAEKAGADKKAAKEGEEYDEGYKLTVSEFVKGLKAADKVFTGEWYYVSQTVNECDP